jgi:pSer/pThr/pTyr-binding forkhead associated (FHA) protein
MEKHPCLISGIFLAPAQSFDAKLYSGSSVRAVKEPGFPQQSGLSANAGLEKKRPRCAIMAEQKQHRLLVLNEKQSLEIPFSQQITIGRDVVNALTLLDKESSRSHAIIYEQDAENGGESLAVKDLDSLNGVFVNGAKVAECALAPGDELIIGGSIIIISPNPEIDLEDCLSEKGRAIVAKIQTPKPFKAAPVTSFTLADLADLADREFMNLDNSAIWSPKNAMVMMRAVGQLAEAEVESDFYSLLLGAACGLVQADQGVVMLQSPSGSALDVRAHFSNQSKQDIVISKSVIRIAMRGSKAFYSPDTETDDRLPDFRKKTPEAGAPHSLLVVPFEHCDESVGFLYLDSVDKNFAYSQWSLILIHMLVQPVVKLAALKGFLPPPE